MCNTTTGHLAICNTWTSIFFILQPQVIQPYATPGHSSIVYYIHRSSSHMQHLDIHLLYTTTTGHPAICNTWTVHLLYTTTTGHPAICNAWTLDSPSMCNTTTGHPAICNTWKVHLLYTTTTGHPAICNTWTVHLLYTTTTGHPAICNIWIFIYCILQP